MAVSVGGSVRAGGSASGVPQPQDNKELEAVGGAVKERIARALRIYKDAAGHGCGGGSLVQVWAPARDGDRRVLATRGQPFVLPPPRCHRLFQYRTVSLTHAFPIGGAAVPGERGLPGRVFDAGEPEWTPNVQYYGTGEYARISYALIYDIQATLALPILDPATGSCLAVLELVTTTPRLHFAAEVDSLSKALQVPPLLQLFILLQMQQHTLFHEMFVQPPTRSKWHDFIHLELLIISPAFQTRVHCPCQCNAGGGVERLRDLPPPCTRGA